MRRLPDVAARAAWRGSFRSPSRRGLRGASHPSRRAEENNGAAAVGAAVAARVQAREWQRKRPVNRSRSAPAVRRLPDHRNGSARRASDPSQDDLRTREGRERRAVPAIRAIARGEAADGGDGAADVGMAGRAAARIRADLEAHLRPADRGLGLNWRE